MTNNRSRGLGFTLVELLVVIAIIGILVSLTMPAINSSREAARITQCQSNLRQVGLAAQGHAEKLGYYPTGGWGYQWVGDADRGAGQNQPGGWIYNVAPYLGLQNVHDMGLGNDRNQRTLMHAAVAPILFCPTRRRPSVYPLSISGKSTAYLNSDAKDGSDGAKTDYAANGGTVVTFGTSASPFGSATMNCYSDGIRMPGCTFPNAKGSSPGTYDNAMATLGDLTKFNGITTMLSRVSQAQIRDGITRTIFAGEKWVDANEYRTGKSAGDTNSAYVGYCSDICRWGPVDTTPANNTTTLPKPFVLDTDSTKSNELRFGSSHAAGCNFVYCDGSVRMITYYVDYKVFSHLCNREDMAGDADL